jgi:hypothetical protein
MNAGVVERLLNNLVRLMPPAADFANRPRAPTAAAAPACGKDDVGPMMITSLVESRGILAGTHFLCQKITS